MGVGELRQFVRGLGPDGRTDWFGGCNHSDRRPHLSGDIKHPYESLKSPH